MSNDTIISFSDPAFHDELTELVRGGALPHGRRFHLLVQPPRDKRRVGF